MWLLINLIVFSQGLMGKSLDEVSGYIGGNVTLPSGADPSWTLSTIDWSIFTNNTWIATYRENKIKAERLEQYKGRLTLNQNSGDLTIHNLRKEDAMSYTVYLYNTENENKVNTIGLNLKQHLQQPVIEQIHNAATENGCFMLLNCSSQDNNVDFSWNVTSHNLSNWVSTDRNPSQLFVYVNTQDSVEFTCTSSRQMEKTFKVFYSKCNVPYKEPPGRDRCGVGGFCVFTACVVIVALIYFLRGPLKALGQHIREKLCPSKN